MNKKLNILRTFLLATMSLLIISCEKTLMEQPQSFVDPSLFFKNENQGIAALNGAHIPLNSIFSSGLMLATEATTDLAFLNSSSLDAKFEISPANPGMGQNVWEQAYQGIMYCNSAIEGIQNSPIDESRKMALVAEGVTLRALYYYVLTSVFGDVPFYTQSVSTLKSMEDIMKIGRMSAVATRNTLIEELKDYAAHLPLARTSDLEQNRISGPLAYMLIAKMAMWNKDYEVAYVALQEIKYIYGSLDQYPLTDTYFRKKNAQESIFEVQFAWSATGLKKTSTVAAFFTPPKSPGTNIYNGIAVPELGSKANPYSSISPSEYFMSLYDVYDPRRNIILAYTYDDKWFSRPQSDNGTGKPWMGAKFWFPGMDNISDGNNQKVFRYADALLMIAECANELEYVDVAMEALNEVKARASYTYILDTYPGKELLFKEIKEERARELMGEYGRKWDLVRWGIFYESVMQTTAEEYEDIKNNLRPYHEYYPISDREVTRSNGVLTNSEYTGY